MDSIVIGESLTTDEFMNLRECANLHIEYDEGRVFNVVPVSGAHASVQTNLVFIFNLFLGSRNTVVSEPYGLKTGADSYLLPDIQVIEDNRTELPDYYYDGVPRLIVEIMSKSSRKRDSVDKLRKYLKLRVPEYWTVDLANQRLDVNILEDRKYVCHTFVPGETVDCGMLQEFNLQTEYIFKGRVTFETFRDIMDK
ncbi:MAG: Uma2 family endonuclease [Peptococcaceae bacterium]|nr:Uma2 family endonuclease [Peptococcaceae bacterium]